MQRKNGISLVVLVITIIVMIILAGTVVISLSDTGIFDRAEDAVNKTNIANINEMLSADAYLKLYTSGNMNKYTDEELQEYYENYMADNGYELPIGYVLKVNKGKVGVLTEIIDATAMKGTGTEADPYQVNCIEHLVLMAQAVNTDNTNVYSGVHFKLMRSLDFKDNLSYADGTNTTQFGDYNADGTTSGIKTELTTGKGWTAIGYQVTVDSTYALTGGQIFCGNFDGNGNTIDNIYTNAAYTGTDTVGFGLFGTNKGTIQNLTVAGSITASSTSAGIAVAGILVCNNGTIKNCINKVNVKYTGEISQSIGAAGVSSINSANAVIVNCKNYGEISLTNNTYYYYCATGGICAASLADVSGCENFESISGHYNTGGIVGMASGIKIYNCYNSGNVNGNHVGGITGQLSNSGEIYNCYNIGSMTNGIVGHSSSNSSCHIVNCYSIGNTERGIGWSGWPTTNCFAENVGVDSWGDRAPGAGEEITTYAALLTSLNTYITENSSSSSVALSSWKIGKNGYPVFDWQE